MLSLKKMVELYVQYELDEDTWDMLRMMRFHGLISSDNWTKFYEKCGSWHKDVDDMVILDEYDKPVYVRNVYTGLFEKCKG